MNEPCDWILDKIEISDVVHDRQIDQQRGGGGGVSCLLFELWFESRVQLHPTRAQVFVQVAQTEELHLRKAK